MKKAILSLILVATMVLSLGAKVTAAPKKQVEFIVTTQDGTPIPNFHCKFSESPPNMADLQTSKTSYSGNTDKNGRIVFDVSSAPAPSYDVVKLYFSTFKSGYTSLDCTMPNGVVERFNFKSYTDPVIYVAENIPDFAGPPLIILDFTTSSTFRVVVNDTKMSKPIPFKDGTILEAHSLDYINRSYHKITDRATIADIASRLNDYTPAVSKDKNQVGFLIVTDKGKYDYYLDNDEKKASANDKPLIALAKKCNEKYFGSVQWLAFMSTSNIVGVTYDGFYVNDVNYKKRKGSERIVDVSTVDKTEIAIISSFLKSVVVDAKPKISNGRTNPQSSGLSYQIGIEFANGSTYAIFGIGDKYEVVITSSDMDESIFYKCTKEQMYAMADMMASLNSAVDF